MVKQAECHRCLCTDLLRCLEALDLAKFLPLMDAKLHDFHDVFEARGPSLNRKYRKCSVTLRSYRATLLCVQKKPRLCHPATFMF